MRMDKGRVAKPALPAAPPPAAAKPRKG